MAKNTPARGWQQAVLCRFLGVDHVLLYDNSGNRGASADALSDFIEAGYLTYTLLPGVSKQIPLYDHCAKVSARRWSWMAAIDLDEFIDVVDPKALVQQGSPLKAVLKDFRFRAGAPSPHASAAGRLLLAFNNKSTPPVCAIGQYPWDTTPAECYLSLPDRQSKAQEETELCCGAAKC